MRLGAVPKCFFRVLLFANCKVKTTVRERAFFIGRMLAFGDLDA